MAVKIVRATICGHCKGRYVVVKDWVLKCEECGNIVPVPVNFIPIGVEVEYPYDETVFYPVTTDETTLQDAWHAALKWRNTEEKDKPSSPSSVSNSDLSQSIEPSLLGKVLFHKCKGKIRPKELLN